MWIRKKNFIELYFDSMFLKKVKINAQFIRWSIIFKQLFCKRSLKYIHQTTDCKAMLVMCTYYYIYTYYLLTYNFNIIILSSKKLQYWPVNINYRKIQNYCLKHKNWFKFIILIITWVQELCTNKFNNKNKINKIIIS